MTVKILGLLAFGLAVSMAANADTETLYYTGSDVTDVTNLPVAVSGSIHGYITLDAPLGPNLSVDNPVNPIAFSFNGGDPLSNLNASAQNLFAFSTDASSNITGWLFALTGTTADGNNVSEGSVFYPASDGNPASAEDLIQINDSIGISTSAGTWSVASVAAPEIDPTSAVGGLMLLLGSLAVMRGRTKVLRADR